MKPTLRVRIAAAIALAQERYGSDVIHVRDKPGACTSVRGGVWVPAEVFVPDDVLASVTGGES